MSTDSESSSLAKNDDARKSNRFRLERFGKAMSGTDGWETPGAVLNGDLYLKSLILWNVHAHISKSQDSTGILCLTEAPSLMWVEE